jgi:hypothetical protein
MNINTYQQLQRFRELKIKDLQSKKLATEQYLVLENN